jgi:hypothetical protein
MAKAENAPHRGYFTKGLKMPGKFGQNATEICHVFCTQTVPFPAAGCYNQRSDTPNHETEDIT